MPSSTDYDYNHWDCLGKTADVSLVETYLQHSCLVLLLLQILVSNTAEILRLSRSAWPVKDDRNKLGGAGFIERTFAEVRIYFFLILT